MRRARRLGESIEKVQVDMLTGKRRPDALPLSSGELKGMKRTPQARIIRRALGLTQEEFAARYHIPLGTLRDWEQGRATPEQPARAYLTVIARSPESLQLALRD
jgi:putative transcriptional regulator